MLRKTRSMKLIAIGLTLCILLMAGCSSNGAKGNESVNKPSNTAGNNTATPSSDDEYRIVSTTVAITDILDALDLNVVGKPSTAKPLPERYSDAIEVGNPMSPDMELVKSLKATHVLSVTTLQHDLEDTFKGLGIEARFLDFTSIEDMKTEITKLGAEFNRVEQAAALVESYDKKISDIKAEVADQQAPTVLILMGIPGSYLVATENSYIGDLVKQLGGANVVTDSKVEFVSSNTEFLQQGNPDVILRAAHGMPEEVIKMFDDEFKQNDIWKHFNAVKNERVYDLPEDFFGTTGNLAADEALDILADMLYPDRKG
ncbi:heme ABC transporter substrate-binding protein IsdE [Paenibacillus endoradicis]|uniref:heme ABC transporter substrate-binding protein IsdE n=1 Tax=Paenibacillus endoradicis TaxID=2972487 RepID=UPI002158FB0E|nr:heme ABC transporter substrate-binding protein IsdE [Paenibacillus endoradicis]MCR8657280.1 heme ABC transporter substrate-binding protein IsdE [Paenibacillus endoradicis]